MKKQWLIAEIICFFLMTMLLLWLAPADWALAAGVPIALWMLISWYFHQDSWSDLGFIETTKPFWITAGLSLVVLYIIAIYINPNLWQDNHLWFQLCQRNGYCLWVIAQELMLQSYLVNRLRQCFKENWQAALVGGALFAIAHLPNPALSISALFLGTISALFFLKLRNIYIIIIAHFLIGTVFLHLIAHPLLKNGGAIGPYFWQ